MVYLDEIVTIHDAPPIEPPTPRHKQSLSQRIDCAIYDTIRTARSCVYFIGNHRAVKIGVSMEVVRRIGEIDRGYEPVRILLLMKGEYGLERELHERFAGLYVRKEWFLHTGELAEFIARERVKFA